MKRIFIFFFGIVFSSVLCSSALAEWNTGKLLLKHNYYHFPIHVTNGGFLTKNEDSRIPLKDFYFSVEYQNTEGKIPTDDKKINTAHIAKYLQETLAPKIYKEPTAVTISKDEHEKVVFDGYGQFGEYLNIPLSVGLIEKAIQENISIVTLAVEKVQPAVVVEHEELKNKGVKELIAIGQSNFSGSSANRRHNVAVGANRFNGFVIPQGEEFSFNNSVGSITLSSGYKSSPVIIGDDIVDGVGGGICQVSTTAFRGAMLAGVNITERWNHRFAISMYSPYGTDATVYQGVKDLQFVNNTPGDIVMQTRIEGDDLYFYYYGTTDSRDVKILGPHQYAYVKPPEPKIMETDELPAGQEKVEEGSISGFRTAYSRIVRFLKAPEEHKPFASYYSPKPKLILRGIANASPVSTEEVARGE